MVRIYIVPKTPNYDSGWTAIALGATVVFTHNLNTLMYKVDVEAQTAAGIVHQHYYGGVHYESSVEGSPSKGFYWHTRTATQISVTRLAQDNAAPVADNVRVRLWMTV
jgi:hypothetical protein